jgi:hypothetical protein
MVGMSKGEIFICLGHPAKKSTTGGSEIWSFTYDTCTANLTLDADKVKAVSYSLSGTDDRPEDEQCEHVPQVVSCLRWLRN